MLTERCRPTKGNIQGSHQLVTSWDVPPTYNIQIFYNLLLATSADDVECKISHYIILFTTPPVIVYDKSFRVKTEKRQASELLLEEDDYPYKEAKFGSGSGESDDEEQDEDMTDDVPYDPNASFLEYGEQDANETAEFIHNSGM